jgi:hypothetical protein
LTAEVSVTPGAPHVGNAEHQCTRD